MKRNYLKPMGELVSLNVNENISASGGRFIELFFGVNYTVENENDPENRKVYIASSTYLASNQNITAGAYSNIVDWLTAMFYPETRNCVYNPVA